MSEFIKRPMCDGVTFSSITDDRFKIGRIGATMIVPLLKETASANALLSLILTRSCKKYPDFTALSKKLDSLYGASLYPSIRQMGDYQGLTFAAAGIDDKYSLDGSSVSSELAELLCSIIFEPNIIDGSFTEEDIEQERRQLLENIDAEYNDKRLYAIKRCKEIMCKCESFAIDPHGCREDVEKLQNDDIVSAWKKLLRESRVELTMLGNSSPEKAYEGFERHFGYSPRTPRTVEATDHTPQDVKRVVQTDDVVQSKLVMGLRCARFNNDEDSLANSLMSLILGGAPTSKLFLNVREKQSLCYYCISRINSSNGIMLIDSGVETENIEKTEAAVMEQINYMKCGNITDSEFDDARLAMKNMLLSSLDSLAALQEFYIGGVLRENAFSSPQKAAEAVDRITKERIVELAQKIELDTVYSLVGN